MKTSMFVGASVDGFIARPDDALDFLPDDGGEPHGYDEFMASVDVLVIGRKTFNKVMTFGEWPFGEKRVVVLSHEPLALPPLTTVERMEGTPASVLARLEASGATHAYVDGGLTLQGFLSAGLLDRMVITRVPVLIGEGIPLFGKLPGDLRLRHVATKAFASGLVQSEYEVLRD
jgi:dihydrofolate reductase